MHRIDLASQQGIPIADTEWGTRGGKSNAESHRGPGNRPCFLERRSSNQVESVYGQTPSPALVLIHGEPDMEDLQLMRKLTAFALPTQSQRRDTWPESTR